MIAEGPVCAQTIRHRSTRYRRWHYPTLVFCSRLALIWERACPCLWQPIALIFLFLGISFMGVFPYLPLWLHTLFVLAFIILLCVISSQAFSAFTMPSEAEVVAWIERRNDIPHRPLSAVQDDLSSERQDAVSQKIWQEHLVRAHRAAGNLSIPVPESEVPWHDPRALRAAAFLTLFIGIVVGYGHMASRLHQALVPASGLVESPMQVDVWVTPPPYTRHRSFHLSNTDRHSPDSPDAPAASDAMGPEYRVPVGSHVLVQVNSGHQPALMLGSREVSFETLGAGGFRADMPVGVSDVSETPSELVIETSGAKPAQWPVHIIADLPPVVDFTKAPAATSRGQLEVFFDATDDYGLEQISLRVVNETIPEGSDLQRVMRMDIPLPQSGTLGTNTSVIRDLGEHEWAGLPVTLGLEASDAIGQTGHSRALSITLPERPFNHPVARKLVEFRKLLNTPDHSTVITTVRHDLDGVSRRPADFNDDAMAFLLMRVAHARLGHLSNEGDLQSVRQILRETALRIEDGELAVARQALSHVQDRLMEALNDGAFDGEIQELLDALGQALGRFMAALSEQLAQKGFDEVSALPGMAYMDSADMMEMLKDAGEFARAGAMDAAQQMLEQLQAMLESVENAMESGGSIEQYKAVRQTLEDLFHITRSQEGLLDQIFQETQNKNAGGRKEGQKKTGNFQPFAQTQEEIRESLRDLMPGLSESTGKVPAPAIESERAMQHSARALAEGKGNDSVSYQSDALDALRRMSEMLAEQMARQMQIPGGAGQGLVSGGRSDPFGRMTGPITGPNGGGNSASNRVMVPSEFHIRRAQELINELRQRANDINRPALELQYIERLLQPF